MIRRFAWALALCTGCLSSGKPITYYMPPLPEQAAATAPAAPSVAVEPFRVAPAYDSAQVTFRSAPAVLRRFSYREWAADPGWLFASLTARRLESRFAQVGAPDAPIPADVVVGGTVRVLEADYRDESVVRVRLAVEFEVQPQGAAEPRLLKADMTASGRDLAEAVARLGPLYAAEVDRLAAEIARTGAQISGNVK
jgi:ABC-type uncharacterized transport system auxiliary subunit